MADTTRKQQLLDEQNNLPSFSLTHTESRIFLGSVEEYCQKGNFGMLLKVIEWNKLQFYFTSFIVLYNHFQHLENTWWIVEYLMNSWMIYLNTWEIYLKGLRYWNKERNTWLRFWEVTRWQKLHNKSGNNSLFLRLHQI